MFLCVEVKFGRCGGGLCARGGEGRTADVPDAEVHVLDAGHFALDEKVDQAAALIRDFLAKRKI